MTQLEVLTNRYNDKAEKNGFPVRDKKFRSYDAYQEADVELDVAIVNKKQKAEEAERRNIEYTIDQTGWNEEIVKGLSSYERRSANSLINIVTEYEETVKQFMDEAEKDIAYAVKWSANSVKESHKFKIANEILNGFEKQLKKDEPMSFRGYAKKVQKSLKDRLLNNYYRGGSSSAFSNAVEDVEREAVSEMIGSFGVLGWLDFEED
jgi:hypothetical protein